MPTSQSQTLTSELLQRLSKFDFGDVPSEFEVKLFFREAEKLKKVDLSEGWMVAGIIDTLVYNYEGAKKAFEKSLSNGPSDMDIVVSNYTLALQRLGRFEEAMELIKKHVSDDNFILLNDAFLLALKTGLFNEATFYAEKLKKFSTHENPDTEHLKDLKADCDELNISESDCSAVHLLALNAVQDKKIPVVEIAVRRNDENDNSLILLFYVDADADTLSNIGLTIIDKLVETDIAAVIEQKVTPLVMKGFKQ